MSAERVSEALTHTAIRKTAMATMAVFEIEFEIEGDAVGFPILRASVSERV